MATMKQIAQLAGVSRGTVDRVLNGRGIVNEKTAQKVRDIAASLNYTPNKAARSLAALKRSLRLAYILPDPQYNAFFDAVEAGIREKAAQLAEFGVEVTIYHANIVAGSDQLAMLDQAVADGAMGIAFAGYNTEPVSAKIRQITASGIPVVAANSDIDNSGRMAYVGSDSLRCGEIAAGMLRMITQGRANVGILVGSQNIQCHTQRVTGFRANIAKNAPGVRIIGISENLDDEFESYSVAKEMLQDHPEIDALFLTGGGSYGACRAVESLKLEKLPAIVCFDCTRTNRPMLEKGVISATICQHPEVQGSLPLELLFQYLALGVQPEQEYYHTDIEILIRESLV